MFKKNKVGFIKIYLFSKIETCKNKTVQLSM